MVTAAQQREAAASWFETGARAHADALLAEQNRLAGHPRHHTTGVALYCERLYSAVLAPKPLILVP